MKIVLYNEFDDLRNDASDKRTQHLHRKITTNHTTTYNIPESNFLEDATLSCFDKELCYCSENLVYSNVLNWFIIIWLWIYCTFIDNGFFHDTC